MVIVVVVVVADGLEDIAYMKCVVHFVDKYWHYFCHLFIMIILTLLSWKSLTSGNRNPAKCAAILAV